MSERTAAATEVAWFEGTPDEAFAYAKAKGKPLFLYWGAEWCPPCHYLKDKIFHRPEFVGRSREFVAVYLDGDDASAQILGEQLDVQGYPTVMVYSAEGEELLRMPSDVPVSRYAAIMDRALRLDRPVKEILDAVLAVGPARADEADLDVLAYYSWGQDSQIDLAEEERLETFRRLWEETPGGQVGVRARFLGLYVGEAASRARDAGEGDEPLLGEAERVRLTEAMLALLADPALCRANVFDVTYGAEGAIGLLQPERGTGRTELIEAWRTAAVRFESDQELSTDDRLTALAASIDLARLETETEADIEEAPLPPSLVERARKHVEWAVGSVSGGSELQTVLNTAAFLLDEVGLAQEAQDLLVDKLDEAEAPYYFMSWLARLKKDGGETEEALTLYRQAWESAGGRYTRFRWGSTYLRRLMDLAPERAEVIETDSLIILDELLTHDDAFALGNGLRLGQLEEAYREWNEDSTHDGTVGRIRDRVRSACERYPTEGEDSQRDRCLGFLEEEA
ncbi:MAG: thioredoxin family protein [Acidobacteriota bacterium]|nr:thioredoxin family protein [Acidobacteriota bacterium]